MPQSSAFHLFNGCACHRFIEIRLPGTPGAFCITDITDQSFSWTQILLQKKKAMGPWSLSPKQKCIWTTLPTWTSNQTQGWKLKVRTVLTWNRLNVSWTTDPMAMWGTNSGASLSCRQSAAAGRAFSLALCGSIKLISWSVWNRITCCWSQATDTGLEHQNIDQLILQLWSDCDQPERLSHVILTKMDKLNQIDRMMKHTALTWITTACNGLLQDSAWSQTKISGSQDIQDLAGDFFSANNCISHHVMISHIITYFISIFHHIFQ